MIEETSMEKEYLSIKDFAAAVGITKQAVYKQLNNKLKPFLKVVENKKMIEKSAISLFEKKTTLNQDEQPLNNQLNERLIDMLQKELEEKGKQLNEKDKQIAELQKLLDQAQMLNAMDKQKLLELENKMDKPYQEQRQEVEEPGKKKWWQKIF